jgi:hypothetical protein
MDATKSEGSQSIAVCSQESSILDATEPSSLAFFDGNTGMLGAAASLFLSPDTGIIIN